MVNDPSQFWQNSAIGKKAKANIVAKEPYKYPDLKDGNGQDVFHQIGLYMLQTHPQEFEKGYLEMDKVWAESPDENLKAYREQLFKEYPRPFSGRKAYLFRIEFETTKEMGSQGVKLNKTLSKLKLTKNDGKKNEGNKFFFQGRV
jgi:hypothetical protein